MEIEIQLTREPIAEKISPPDASTLQRFNASTTMGAWLEFRGVVRGEENGQKISALEYEAYPEMAVREIRRLLQEISTRHPALAAKVIHRVGAIPVGETAIYIGVASPHRGEAIALLAEFMDRLKQDVPIWKRRGIVAAVCDRRLRQEPAKAGAHRAPLQLDEALAEIQSRCQPLPAVRVPLADAFGRLLRETVFAPGDLPDCDRSTRDGYAILRNDASDIFQIIDTVHAADWKPRELKPGQAVRIATGAALPSGNVRVVMQEHAERNDDRIKILKREEALNIRRRGEDVKAGAPLVKAGEHLNSGRLALLASAGCVKPLVSPRLRVIHFTTGDEIIPPDQTPKPGQVRDSNSILIRGLLQTFPCEVSQSHLLEDFEAVKKLISTISHQPSAINLLLISGGASVGDKDFTRELLEWLGFEIVFSQVNVRPGRPLIFGAGENQIAFGLPGNPLSHFVCFHVFVATALAKLVGAQPKTFLRGRLAAQLNDAPNPRETLWPARRNSAGLHALAWASSGDITCLAETNALIRMPANRGPIEAGAAVDFWPA